MASRRAYDVPLGRLVSVAPGIPTTDMARTIEHYQRLDWGREPERGQDRGTGHDARVFEFTTAITRGDAVSLRALLAADPGLATSLVNSRTPLHLFANAPGSSLPGRTGRGHRLARPLVWPDAARRCARRPPAGGGRLAHRIRRCLRVTSAC